MKNNLTELVFVIDRSGSMNGLESDTIGGFNSMIEKQRSGEGTVYVSTVLFSTDRVVIHDRRSIEGVDPMTEEQYSVGGCTALLDAVGSAIHHIGNVHKYAREEDVPEKTLFVIITDGLENASREYSRAQVKRMIDRQKEKYGWEFIFLGANMDAGEVAEDIGIERDRSATYCCDSVGTSLNYEALEDVITSVRECGAIRKEWKKSIEADERKRGRRR